MDKKIRIYQKKAGVQPSSRQASAPPPRREKLVRTPFTEEDDGRIVEFLAEARSSQGARLGLKLWKALEDVSIHFCLMPNGSSHGFENRPGSLGSMRRVGVP